MRRFGIVISHGKPQLFLNVTKLNPALDISGKIIAKTPKQSLRSTLGRIVQRS